MRFRRLKHIRQMSGYSADTPPPLNNGGCNSVGRAPLLHSGGQGFEPPRGRPTAGMLLRSPSKSD